MQFLTEIIGWNGRGAAGVQVELEVQFNISTVQCVVLTDKRALMSMSREKIFTLPLTCGGIQFSQIIFHCCHRTANT